MKIVRYYSESDLNLLKKIGTTGWTLSKMKI